MIIISTLTALFAIIFLGGSGPDEFFQIDRGSKILKNTIKENERYNEVAIHYKEAERAIKDHDSKLKEYRKELGRIQMDKTISRTSLINYYAEIELENENLQELLSKKRLTIRKSMTKEEWDDFISKALASSEQKEIKRRKAEFKSELSEYKMLHGIKMSIKDEIADEKIRNKALDLYTTMEQEIDSMTEVNNSNSFINNETLRAYSVSIKELTKAHEEINQSQYESFKAFMDLRDFLIEETKPKEWKSISKSIKKSLFKAYDYKF